MDDDDDDDCHSLGCDRAPAEEQQGEEEEYQCLSAALVGRMAFDSSNGSAEDAERVEDGNFSKQLGSVLVTGAKYETQM